MPKITKMTKIMFVFFSTFLGRRIWLPRAMLANFFDFLTPLGIFLGVYIRNWSNFHFWAFWKGSKIPKITNMTMCPQMGAVLSNSLKMPLLRIPPEDEPMQRARYYFTINILHSLPRMSDHDFKSPLSQSN